MNKPLTSNDPSNPSIETQQNPPKDAWDELAELAAMTGYKSDPPPGKKVVAKETPLLDAEDLEELDKEHERTKVPLWSNGLAKAALAAIALGLVIGGVYWFIHNLKANMNAPTIIPPTSTEPQEEEKTDPDQEEIGRLKTLNALASQAQMMTQNSQRSRSVTSTREAPKTRSTPKPSPMVSQAVPPAPRPQYTTTYPAPVRPFAPFTPPSPALRSYPAMAQPALQPVPQVAPEESWQKALAVGNFGGDDRNAPTTEPETIAVPDTPVAQSKGLSPDKTTDQVRYEADAAALITGEPSQMVTIAPGTQTKATLTTPIVWAQDLKPDQQPQRFTVQLTESLQTADGSVILPAGSQMIARVDTVSDSGMMQLSVIAAVVPGEQVLEIPSSTLLILAAEGSPLIAESQNPQRDEVFNKDLTVALFGALGQVGSLLNRASQQTTMTSPYLSTTSTTNGQVNLLGGVLEGGFNKLADRMAGLQKSSESYRQRFTNKDSCFEL